MVTEQPDPATWWNFRYGVPVEQHNLSFGRCIVPFTNVVEARSIGCESTDPGFTRASTVTTASAWDISSDSDSYGLQSADRAAGTSRLGAAMPEWVHGASGHGLSLVPPTLLPQSLLHQDWFSSDRSTESKSKRAKHRLRPDIYLPLDKNSK